MSLPLGLIVMPVVFPRRLQLAQLPTPLMALDRLSAIVKGPRIWVKRDDLTGSAVSGNKIRKLEFVLADAIDQGCDTIITIGGIQSNHCRTTALLCAQLGLKCHLILRGKDAVADGNLLLDKLAGAEISFYSECECLGREQELLKGWKAHYAEQGSKAYIIPVGASDGTGIWGYIAACKELKKDFARHEIQPKHIISATGSGGTQAGLTVGNELYKLGATIWGVNVCDDADYFINKVSDDIAQWKEKYSQNLDVKKVSIQVIEGYVGSGYGKAGPEVFDTIKLLAKTEGLILDPVYTGKAFHGMIEQIKQGRFDDSDDIVFVHTGGIFGVFPQKEQFSF
jgi:D-cysteine desulfhydrase